MRILLIEDDIGIAATLKDLLSTLYTVDVAPTGKEGIYLAQITEYDLIMLDLGLPDIDGHLVCQAIRASDIATPILIITGRDTIDDKVSALDGGADDYVLKPFNFPELSARIRAIMRRGNNGSVSNILNTENLTLDTVSRKVTRGGKSIFLRRKEFDLLEYLLRNQGRVLTRSMILDHIWDANSSPFSNIVDVHIKYLRDQIDKPFKTSLIKTIHGVGYIIPK